MQKLLFIGLLCLFFSCDDSQKAKQTEALANRDSLTYDHKFSSLLDSASPEAENERVLFKKVDSGKIQQLEKIVNKKKDEYNGVTWIQPKSAPRYRSSNAIYCYFSKTENGVNSLRFVIQYYADEWLFIRNYKFVIDGKLYSYLPMNVETDNGNGGYIWEWIDEPVHSSDMDLINALRTAKTAKVKFEGRQYYDEKIISAKQIKDINNIVELYQAMGGEISSF